MKDLDNMQDVVEEFFWVAKGNYREMRVDQDGARAIIAALASLPEPPTGGPDGAD